MSKKRRDTLRAWVQSFYPEVWAEYLDAPDTCGPLMEWLQHGQALRNFDEWESVHQQPSN